jgi:Ca2+-binding RTX toxin-like protein
VDAVTVIVPPPEGIKIDIKPGDAANQVNLISDSQLAVAVLTNSDFDASDVDASDLSRIRFGDVNGTSRVSPVSETLGDVDGDGDLDRVFVFSVKALRRSGALTPTTTQAELTGVTFGGEPFAADDSIAVVHPIVILPPMIEADPLQPGTSVLVVEGTPGNDRILVRPRAGSPTNLEVIVNGFVYGPFAPTGGVRAYGYAGNDRIEVASSVAREAILDGAGGNDTLLGGRGNDLLAGGPGNDTLYGRPGNDVLTGGDGNDTLTAGLGRDVLMGGAGADRLVAGSAGSILVAGPTLFDLDPAALAAIRDEWSSARGYAARAANLRGENNPQFAGRLNGNYFLRAASPSPTAFDDGARDTLVGGLGMDWFLVNRNGGVTDVLSGSSPSEFKDELG